MMLCRMALRASLPACVGLWGMAEPMWSAQTVVLEAGAVVDPAAGRTSGPQIIVVENGRITAVGRDLAPAGATVVDLSDLVVLPGLFETHTHLAAAYDPARSNLRDFNIAVSTAERALLGVVNAWQMLAAGFTTVRDLGNAGNYADAALATFFGSGSPGRRAIYGSAVLDNLRMLGQPVMGPTIVYSGKIIAPFGGQFTLSPEHPDVGRQDYIYADTRDELRAAIRRNLHYGATWIKVVVDDYPYRYSVDDLRFIVAEAKQAGARVAAHCVTEVGVRDAIAAGVASIEHGYRMSDEALAMARERGVVLVGTEPDALSIRRTGPTERYRSIVDRLARAHQAGVRLAFGADIVRAPPEHSRAEITLSVVDTWLDAGMAPADILRAMTATAAELLGMEGERGAVKPGYAADLIATRENPLDDIHAVKRVLFVMKDGKVFKRPDRQEQR